VTLLRFLLLSQLTSRTFFFGRQVKDALLRFSKFNVRRRQNTLLFALKILGATDRVARSKMLGLEQALNLGS